jgi:sulfur carrier protein ThiS
MEISSILHKKIPPSDKNLNSDKWDIPEGTSVTGILEMLNLTEVYTILVLNGRQGNKSSILKEGDLLKIFPAASGG